MHEQLLEFIQTQLLRGNGLTLRGPDDELLASGVIDSLGVIELLTFIEQQLAIRVPPADVTVQNFQTVNAMTRYLRTLSAH
jgi:acyl carrier protein